jgi:UDP-N-acetylglucosamine 2-epimerase
MAEALRKHVDRMHVGKWAIALGDRKEMCERALDLVYQGYRLAHVAGGETRHDSPEIAHPDHRTRNAISMLSDLHFVCNDFAKANLKRIGIIKHVYVTGLPSLDELVHVSRMPAPDREDFALILIHPHPSDKGRSNEWVKAAADALVASECKKSVLLEPNIDDGGCILDQLRNWGGMKECLQKRVGLDDFVEHLRRCSVFITNSSSGRIEAPIFGTKVIEIGDRQTGRAPIGTAWHHADGRACSTIAGILRECCV